MNSELSQLVDLSPSSYDIAAISLVPGPRQARCVDWLLKHARTEHTWGAPADRCWFDAYLSTYAAAIAIRNAGMGQLADRACRSLSEMVLASPLSAPETLTFGGLVDVLDRISATRGWPLPAYPHVVHSIIDGSSKLTGMLVWAGYCR